jgi:ATP-binding cassette subfamily C protein CydC
MESMLGLRPPVCEIKIAGKSLASYGHAELRANFAWLPQDAALVSGTVRDNLLLGAPHSSDECCWKALADAAIDDRIRMLQGGLDGWIGQYGEELSGGERRRLALARALLTPSPWLLLDEPTEGLDAKTEALVLDRLFERLAETNRGLILATHRANVSARCRHSIDRVTLPKS